MQCNPILIKQDINIFSKTMIKVLVACFAIFLIPAFANQCINPSGAGVDWWVNLLFPKSQSNGFAYFDSTFTAPSFVTSSKQADTNSTPLTRTLNQINTIGMDAFAWNDEKPDGKTSSSRAHAKGVLAYNPKKQKGFYIVHSIPQFPAFNGLQVNTTIEASQLKFGQHILCISIDKSMYYELISNILPIRPNIYASNFVGQNSVQKMIADGLLKPPNYATLFNYMNRTNMQFIFKNGGRNGSIFEDGLNNMLKSPLLAQTWGRPLQDPWCGSAYGVGNVQTIKISNSTDWTQTQDHSKWAYATKNDNVCFGDMNRMESQWKRGGAFYCIKSAPLKKAMVSITGVSIGCK